MLSGKLCRKKTGNHLIHELGEVMRCHVVDHGDAWMLQKLWYGKQVIRIVSDMKKVGAFCQTLLAFRFGIA